MRFQFKEFAVEHGDVGMKVGTDGVLLGAWVECESAQRILDVGTGSGLIALMVAQRNPKAIIEAVDIDEQAIKTANLNFNESPWASRMHAKVADFLTYEPQKPFDLIVSNPPFFDHVEAGQKLERIKARSASHLPLEGLLQRTKSLLSKKGAAAFILPFTQMHDFEKISRDAGFYMSRLTELLPNENKGPNRFLCQIKIGNGDTAKDLLVVNEVGGGYTAEHRELTKAFYLDQD